MMLWIFVMIAAVLFCVEKRLTDRMIDTLQECAKLLIKQNAQQDEAIARLEHKADVLAGTLRERALSAHN